MTLRAGLRLLLLAAMLFAPIGRIGMAQAMTGHCATPPAAAPAHHQAGHEQPAPRDETRQMAIDCMIACAAMAPAPAPAIAPPFRAVAMTGVPTPSSLTGIRPEADPPPPRIA